MPKHAHKPFVTMNTDPLTPRPWHSTVAGKAAITATALALATATGVGVTGARFSDGVEVVAEVGSGSLDVTVNGEQGNPTAVRLTMPPEASLLAPGKKVTTTMLVQNAGTLPAKVNINIAGKGAGFLGAQLDATLTVSAVSTYTAKANGLSLEPFPIAAGATVPVTLDLVLPADTDNTWMAKSDELTVTYTAVQG
jgi:hypothetical protein